MNNCTPWARSTFGSEKAKSTSRPKRFWQFDVEKVHAVVARSTFGSQNAQSTPCSEHFWKLRCSKSARCCGAKHILKSKCTKHVSLGALLEVEMLESARRCGAKFGSQTVQNTTCSRHFWTLKRRFVWKAQGILHPAKSEQNLSCL